MLQVNQSAADSKGLRVKRRGRPFPQEGIIDIKTRSAFHFETCTIKEIDMTDLTPRRWVFQIPTLIVSIMNTGSLSISVSKVCKRRYCSGSETTKERYRN